MDIPTRQGFYGFQRSLHPCALDKKSLSIGRVNHNHYALTVTCSIPRQCSDNSVRPGQPANDNTLIARLDE